MELYRNDILELTTAAENGKDHVMSILYDRMLQNRAFKRLHKLRNESFSKIDKILQDKWFVNWFTKGIYQEDPLFMLQRVYSDFMGLYRSLEYSLSDSNRRHLLDKSNALPLRQKSKLLK